MIWLKLMQNAKAFPVERYDIQGDFIKFQTIKKEGDVSRIEDQVTHIRNLDYIRDDHK